MPDTRNITIDSKDKKKITPPRGGATPAVPNETPVKRLGAAELPPQSQQADVTHQAALFPVVDTGKAPACPTSPTRKEAEKRATQEEKTRKAELTALWLAHPKAVPLDLMSDSERRSFHSGMWQLTHDGVTPKELPSLMNAQAQWSKGTYIPNPHSMHSSLGTLRTEAMRLKQTTGGDSHHVKQSGSDWSTPISDAEAEGIIQC